MTSTTKPGVYYDSHIDPDIMQKATSQAERWAKMRDGNDWESRTNPSAFKAMTMTFARVRDRRRNHPRTDVAIAAQKTVANMLLRDDQVAGGTWNHALPFHHPHTGMATITSWTSHNNKLHTDDVSMMNRTTTMLPPYEHMAISDGKGGYKQCMTSKCIKAVVQ